jgi:DNA-binding NarL/FixJ family response regulator
VGGNTEVEASSARAPLRVAVVEDQPLFRGMLVDLLEGRDDLVVVASAADVTSARQLIQPGTADVAVLDIELPDGNGFGLGVSLRGADPGLGIVLLSGHDLMEILLVLSPEERAGWSYLSKVSSTSADTLVRAVRASARGGAVLDPTLVERLTPRTGSPLASLSPRQLRALRLLADGLSNAAIAREMGISAHSVDNLLNAIYAALDVRADPATNPRVRAALLMLEQSARGSAG